jgi:scyllo-inositol 2-dehydrogenase (NADP+)
MPAAAASHISIALVGLGWVGQARHLPALLRHRGYRLLGVIDRDAAQAAAVAARWRLPYHAGSTTLRDVPWLEQVAAVSIATPPMTHHDLVCAALQQGKHVLTEKPFAMNVSEGAAMQAAATAAHKQLAVVHNFQFARALRRLEALLAAGRLGTLQWVAARQWGNPRRRLPSWYATLPLGLFYDESPHFYYLLRRLAGELTLQDAVARGQHAANNTPDEIRLLYQGADGLKVSIDCNFSSPLSEWGLLVGGSAGLAMIDIFRDFCLFLPQDGTHDLPHILRTSWHATWQHWAQYVPNGLDFLRGRLDYGNDTVLQRFQTSIITAQPPLGIAATDAQAVLRLQHAAIEQVRWL